MKHQGTKRLETDRLILRQFKIEDADAVYNNWASDPEVTRYLTWPCHTTVDITENVLMDWTGQYSKEDYYQWAIVLRENGDEPIGSIAVVRKDDAVEMVHIGYCIGKKWWYEGIKSEVLF
jgi:ribosomal-protein-alanine N-acetyltransferase